MNKPALKRDMPRIEVREFPLTIKANEAGVVEGYGAVFGNIDLYSDVVAAGAFAKSIDVHIKAGTMPAMLWQHNANEPIGVWTEMAEDANGLRVKGQLALNTTRGKEAHELMKMGALNGLSVGFITEQYEYDVDTDVRTITEANLWEVSTVTFPANTKARVLSVKSLDALAKDPTPKNAENYLRDSGMSKSERVTFVSLCMRMGERRRESAQSTDAAIKAADRLLYSLKSNQE